MQTVLAQYITMFESKMAVMAYVSIQTVRLDLSQLTLKVYAQMDKFRLVTGKNQAARDNGTGMVMVAKEHVANFGLLVTSSSRYIYDVQRSRTTVLARRLVLMIRNLQLIFVKS